MKLRLREEPREWQKFMIAFAALISLVGFGLHRRGLLPGWPWLILTPCASGVVLCFIRPRWFRSFYRTGMTVGFHVGQVVGTFLLVVLFVALLTPMGWLLRWFGKDLLRLKRNSKATTYWCSAKENNQFDRQF